MADPAEKQATYADLEALPPNVFGQIVFGVLHALPRPRIRHAFGASALAARIGGPFSYDPNGPGGWVVLIEPELHLTEDVLVPDLAGWQRTRMPEVADSAYLTLPPDWICEILSASTRSLDLTDKRAIYLRERVAHLWFVDPEAKTLEVQRWSERGYVTLGAWRDEAVVCAEPFDAIELPLATLWAR